MFEIEHCTPDCLKIQYRNTPVVYNFSRIQTDFIHLYLSESAVPHDPSHNCPYRSIQRWEPVHSPSPADLQ